LLCGEIKDLAVGNTKIVAEKIAYYTDAEILELLPVVNYPTNYDETVFLAEKEKQEDLRPEFKPLMVSAVSEVIFLGFPNWCGVMPRIVVHFLEKYDFSNKIIYPFCTHEGSAFGSSLFELKQLCPDSSIMAGLPIKGSNVAKADTAIKNWLVQYKKMEE